MHLAKFYIEKNKQFFMKNINKIMKILSKKYPNRGVTTLNRMSQEDKTNPFKILISCLLSLRARDENTEKVSKQLFKVADTPKQILKLSIKKLEKLIFSSGHYHKKAQTLKHVSQELINKFNSQVPKTKEELLSIKGIGPKTANIVLNFAYNQPVLPIDTHCHRIPNRIGWIQTKTPEKTETALEQILPKKYWQKFNSIFVQFGREICQPISPWCSKCPLNKFCKKIGIKRSR
jgi:endonuclease III